VEFLEDLVNSLEAAEAQGDNGDDDGDGDIRIPTDDMLEEREEGRCLTKRTSPFDENNSFFERTKLLRDANNSRSSPESGTRSRKMDVGALASMITNKSADAGAKSSGLNIVNGKLVMNSALPWNQQLLEVLQFARGQTVFVQNTPEGPKLVEGAAHSSSSSAEDQPGVSTVPVGLTTLFNDRTLELFVPDFQQRVPLFSRVCLDEVEAKLKNARYKRMNGFKRDVERIFHNVDYCHKEEYGAKYSLLMDLAFTLKEFLLEYYEMVILNPGGTHIDRLQDVYDSLDLVRNVVAKHFAVASMFSCCGVQSPNVVAIFYMKFLVPNIIYWGVNTQITMNVDA